MIENEVGAGVPDLPRPAVTGGLTALKSIQMKNKCSENDH
jgi:hypothetical protein